MSHIEVKSQTESTKIEPVEKSFISQELAHEYHDLKASTQLEQIKDYVLKQAASTRGIQYQVIEEEEDKLFVNEVFVDNNNLSERQKRELRGSSRCAATGTASEAYGRLLIEQTMEASFSSKRDAEYLMNAIHEAMLDLKPRDIYEGQMCSRLIALHQQYMTCLSRSAHADLPDQIIDLNTNRATKLMRVYNETFEALSRYRRQGEQKVTVTHQHVQVNNGGQAVVAGQFNGGLDKK
jgi:hypothetical protein